MLQLSVLFHDRWLLAVDKPSGLAVHRGWAADDDTAVDRVREMLGEKQVFPVHRLDRGTSGVLLFALRAETAALMGSRFENGEAHKSYLAAVRGIPPGEGLIDHPVRRGEEKDSPRVPARTRYRCLESVLDLRYSLVEAYPETGRLHQVRRHLKHLNHPLLGDVNYGRGEHNRLCRDRFGLFRLALHARSLRVRHPHEDREIEVTAPLPADLAEPLQKMGFRSQF